MNQEMLALQETVHSLKERLESQESELERITSQFREWTRQAHAHCPSCGQRSLLQGGRHRNKQFSDLPLSEAIMTCLFEYDYGVSARTLREKLKERGYPSDKLGRYGNRLHAEICRLIKSVRIQRGEGDEIIAIR